VSATHPDDLPSPHDLQLADAMVWKPRLRPALIEEIWRTLNHGGARAQR